MRKLRHNRIVQALVMGGLLSSTVPPMAFAQGTTAQETLKRRAETQARAQAGAPPVVPAAPVAVPPRPAVGTAPAPAAAPPVVPATEQPVSNGEKKAPRTPSGVRVSFDFTDFDLGELVKRISEMTGKNFILTEPLQGKKVTILSPTKITVEEAYQVFLSVLRSAGYTVVPIGRSLKVVPVAAIASEAIPTLTEGDGRSENYVTRLFTVENIDVDQIAGALGKLFSPNGSIITYAPTNTLIMTDTATNLERLIEIIRKLDVESPTEQLVILQVRYASAQDMADKLMSVYGDDGTSTGGGARGRATAGQNRNQANNRRANRPVNPPQGGGATNTSLGEEGPKISKIIADERTNSLIILASEKALEDIKALVSKLDVDVDENMKSDIHVKVLKFAKAEELAATLANLAGTGGGGGFGSTGTTGRTGSTGSQFGRSGSSGSQFGRSNTSGAGSQFGRPGTSGGSGFGGSSGSGSQVATFEGGVRITADPSTNALVITASYNDYQTLRKVIDQLDVRRKQVFVEAVILELSQDKNRTLGVNYHTGIPGSGLLAGGVMARGSQSLALTDSSVLSGIAVGVFGQAMANPPASLQNAIGALTGVTDTSSVSIPAFGIVLQALQNDKDVNILSTPSILTSNNQEAKIVVGQNVPFQSGSTISTIGSNISITREDVALTLKVTPQVTESGEVTMQVFQEITEVVPGTTSNPLGPTTTKRQAETVVSILDNQTVVIGGLIAVKENYAEDKVPILGDIPLLGFLFRTKTKQESKSNLLIFLTPHIIDTAEDLQNVYRIKMVQRQEFIRRFYGKSREEQLRELDNLVKYSMNLPDVPPIYPERVQVRPEDTTIHTVTPRRGYMPLPGANPNDTGPIMVPVLPNPQSAPAPEQKPEGSSISPPAGSDAPAVQPAPQGAPEKKE